MPDCICSGLVAGLRNYSSNGKQGCNLSVRVSSGELYKFIVRKQIPEYEFGTPVNVLFDIAMFNDKPNNLIAHEVELSKKGVS